MLSSHGRAVKVRLSPADIETADRCARRLEYQRVLKVQVQTPAAADVFANCVTEGVARYLTTYSRGEPCLGLVSHFRSRWQECVSHTALQYGPGQSARSYERAGLELMRLLPQAWESTGLKVAQDRAGDPLVTVPMRSPLGVNVGIDLELVGNIALIVESPTGILALLHPACELRRHESAQVRRAELLTGYQELFDVNRGARGLPELDRVGFWDFLIGPKPSIAAPVLVPARTPLERRLYRERAWWLAEAMHRGSLPRNTHGPRKMPCRACEYVRHCHGGDTIGLRFPEGPPPAA